MNIHPSYISCGIAQLCNLPGTPQDWKSGIKKLIPSFSKCACSVCAEYRRKNPGADWRSRAFLIFSDNTNSNPNGGYGEQFAAWLKENNLGDVTEVVAGTNPNSGNLIKMWTWAVPRDKAVFEAALEAAKV
jgi:hypothetical protein